MYEVILLSVPEGYWTVRMTPNKLEKSPKMPLSTGGAIWSYLSPPLSNRSFSYSHFPPAVRKEGRDKKRSCVPLEVGYVFVFHGQDTEAW